MKYVFMGYITIVIGRFYCCVIRDLISTWGEASVPEPTRAGSIPNLR
jgi:hypothetical protein